jgi:hypothetical protein
MQKLRARRHTRSSRQSGRFGQRAQLFRKRWNNTLAFRKAERDEAREDVRLHYGAHYREWKVDSGPRYAWNRLGPGAWLAVLIGAVIAILIIAALLTDMGALYTPQH